MNRIRDRRHERRPRNATPSRRSVHRPVQGTETSDTETVVNENPGPCDTTNDVFRMETSWSGAANPCPSYTNHVEELPGGNYCCAFDTDLNDRGSRDIKFLKVIRDIADSAQKLNHRSLFIKWAQELREGIAQK